MDCKDVTINIEIKISDEMIKKIKENTDCMVRAKATCVTKTKIIVEILEA